MRLAILSSAILVFATAATAAAPPEQPAAPADKPEKKICRTEKATGSLTRRTRICLTEAEWREVHTRTRSGLDDFTRSASGGCMAPRGGNTMCGG